MKLYGTVELVKGGEETVLILDVITVKKLFRNENVAIIVPPDGDMNYKSFDYLTNVFAAPIGEAKLFATGTLKSSHKEEEVEIVKFMSFRNKPCAIILRPNGNLTWTLVTSLYKFRYEEVGGQL